MAEHKCRTCKRRLDNSHYTQWLAKTTQEDPFHNGNQTCNSCRLTASRKFELALNRPDWMEQAACRGKDTNLWFADGRSNQAHQAAKICQSCPVKDLCGAYASSTLSEGIWGGERHFFAYNGGRRREPEPILEPTVDDLKPLAKRGRKSMLENGICTNGKHRIRGEEDLIVRLRGDGSVGYRCLGCDREATARKNKILHDTGKVTQRDRYQVGGVCKNGHALTEDTLYYAKAKRKLPNGLIQLRDGARCRTCTRASAERTRRNKGQLEGRGRHATLLEAGVCAQGHPILGMDDLAPNGKHFKCRKCHNIYQANVRAERKKIRS